MNQHRDIGRSDSPPPVESEEAYGTTGGPPYELGEEPPPGSPVEDMSGGSDPENGPPPPPPAVPPAGDPEPDRRPEPAAGEESLPGLPARHANIEEPYDIDLERIMLGELLLTNEIAEEIEGYLEAKHFYTKAHQEIFRNIAHLVESGREANIETVAPFVESHPDVRGEGGRDYLGVLLNAAVGLSDWRTYADILRDLFMRRRLGLLARKMLHDSHRADVGVTGLDRVESVEQELYELTVGEREATGTVSFRKALKDAMDQAEQAYRSDRNAVGLPTGFRDIDEFMGGLVETDLIVMAGRPGMGKTALATAIVSNVALPHRAPRPDDPERVVLFFSLEMSAPQLAMRMASARGQISGSDIRRGKLNSSEMDRLIQVSQKIEMARVFIDDSPALTPPQMRTRARRLKRREGRLDLIVVDYIQLMQIGSDMASRIGNRTEEISQITRSLKVLAKELNVPILALSQLSRQVENREDKRPLLSDLRESGSIEQDADVVMFLYRQAYYVRRDQALPEEGEGALEPDPNSVDPATKMIERLAEVIVAKHRHGPLGSVDLNFDGRYTEFSDLASHPEVPV